MSSTIKTTTQQSSEPATAAKKKFGKNLNKLTKPPAPPAASGAKSSASSRNGLLLLSTKRPSTGANPASSETGAAKGGILSNKSSSQAAAKPLPSLGLQYESNTSTHDALLGAVVGASRIEAQQQPDAWGVAEKHQKGFGDEPTTPEHGGGMPSPESGRLDRYGGTDDSRYETQHAKLDDFGGNRQRPSDAHDVMYGQGHVGDSRQQQQESGEDVQGQFMSRAAHERAETRRMEEEARVMRQKERSAQKLLELEQRMTSAERDTTLNTLAGGPPSEIVSQQVVLETLSRPGSNASGGGGGGTGSRQHAATTSGEHRGASGRTLFDPNSSRTYSSLVGGGASKDEKQRHEERSAESSEGATSNKGAPRPGGHYAPTSAEASNNPSDGDPNQYSRQVIHLSSYEDRDRGEQRTTSAAPRMLFDPKSGSMVAVPVRGSGGDDSGPGGRGRKERVKKPRNGREKDSKSDSRQDSSANEGGPNTKSGRKGKGRKDENGVSRGRSVGDASSPSKAELKKPRPANSTSTTRKLPRTCGVLYSRDGKGSFCCADGCDGDLGYGAHSVPGGRNKNPEAYTKVVEDQKQLYHHEETPEYEDQNMEGAYIAEPHSRDQSAGGSVTLQTGFSLPEPKEPKLDWVKPNEKIVLVTGIDDSPTLQATAKEFAPSRAALAAAAAAKEQEKVSGVATSTNSVGSVDVLDDEDTDEDDDDTPFGLGFDPTLNMDSVMQSPSSGPSKLDAVDLASLSLEPALKSATNSHIFAFESGATWGASSSTGSNDWGLPSGGNVFGNDGQNGTVGPATFLSLSSSSTWGTPSVPGFGRTPLTGAALNGETTRSTGD